MDRMEEESMQCEIRDLERQIEDLLERTPEEIRIFLEGAQASLREALGHFG
jgi:hypothetical protein